MTLQDVQIAELRRRLEILERYVAFSMSSSDAKWDKELGLQIPGPVSRVSDDVGSMIMGRIPWDPVSLDKGG